MKKLISLLLLTVMASCCNFANGADVRSNTSDLEAFGKSFGIINYYSPNPYTEKWINGEWIKVCYYMLQQFEVNSATPLPDRLSSIFAPLIQEVSFTTKPIQSDNVNPVADDDYYYIEHTGAGKIQLPWYTKMLYKEYRHYNPYFITYCLANGNEGTPVPGKFYSYEVTDGIYINIPIAQKKDAFNKYDTKKLLRDAEKQWQITLHNYANSNEELKKLFLARTTGLSHNLNYRYTDIIMRWNVVQHFYPYHEEDGLQWNEYLPVMLDSIKQISNTNDAKEDVCAYYENVSSLMNPVHDAHLMTTRNFSVHRNFGTYITYHYLPVMLNMIEDKIVVEAIAPDYETGLTKGCIIEKIGSIDAMEQLKRKALMKNSSNDRHRLYQSLPQILSSYKQDTTLIITYSTPDGVQSTDSLSPTLLDPYYVNNDVKTIAVTDDNIVIFNPRNKMECYKEFTQNLDTIRKARGIVFDLRGYPAYDFEQVIGHFTKKPLSNSFLSTPISCFPNRENIVYKNADENLLPMEPYIDIPVVYITDYHAMSFAETVLMFVKGYDLGTIIGSNTCGTNGDTSRFSAFSFGFPMTVVKAVNVDGSQHHGIGVVPDIYIELTLEGYLSGRDEVLEKGIEYLRNL